MLPATCWALGTGNAKPRKKAAPTRGGFSLHRFRLAASKFRGSRAPCFSGQASCKRSRQLRLPIERFNALPLRLGNATDTAKQERGYPQGKPLSCCRHPLPNSNLPNGFDCLANCRTRARIRTPAILPLRKFRPRSSSASRENQASEPSPPTSC